ncbi:16S rRNA (guanine(527)-N(7))-methyltransferase RsmG [bacterium]|nr:16S rRNA (guanine(527)-N(7))-methyltransferase RsmG [bacterium]
MEEKIKRYIELLKEYNEKVNIYSKKAYDKLDFHIQDCINIAKLIGNKKIKVMDVGSGAGLPAVIMAILNHKNEVTAVESKSRKTNFLEIVKKELALDNLMILNKDINTLKGQEVEVFTAKAFAKPMDAIRIIGSIAPKKTKLIIPISEKQAVEIEAVKAEDENRTLLRVDNYIYMKYFF